MTDLETPSIVTKLAEIASMAERMAPMAGEAVMALYEPGMESDAPVVNHHINEIEKAHAAIRAAQDAFTKIHGALVARKAQGANG